MYFLLHFINRSSFTEKIVLLRFGVWASGGAYFYKTGLTRTLFFTKTKRRIDLQLVRFSYFVSLYQRYQINCSLIGSILSPLSSNQKVSNDSFFLNQVGKKIEIYLHIKFGILRQPQRRAVRNQQTRIARITCCITDLP